MVGGSRNTTHASDARLIPFRATLSEVWTCVSNNIVTLSTVAETDVCAALSDRAEHLSGGGASSLTIQIIVATHLLPTTNHHEILQVHRPRPRCHRLPGQCFRPCS